MEPNTTTNPKYEDVDIRRKLLAKLLEPVKKHGIQQLRMDDITKAMDISRATLYKYFSSRDEIFEQLVSLLIIHMIDSDMKELPLDVGEQLFRCFRSSFLQSLWIAYYGSDVFYRDLREAYPELTVRISASMADRKERLQQFYQMGMELGLIHRQNASLIVVQDEWLFRGLLDPLYFMHNTNTLQSVLYDYYMIKKLQLFPPHTAVLLDDAEMQRSLEHAARKIALRDY